MEANERLSLDKVNEVGYEVAAMYGSVLKSYKIQTRKQKVVYILNDNGDLFESEMSFDEIKQW
jgi:hypothetical protein